MIDAYLTCKAEADDAAMHLLFSANRWEKRCVLCAYTRKRSACGASLLQAVSVVTCSCETAWASYQHAIHYIFRPSYGLMSYTEPGLAA